MFVQVVVRSEQHLTQPNEKVKYTEAKASVGLRVNKFANSEGTRLGHRQQQIGVEDAAARSSVTLEIDGLALPEGADRQGPYAVGEHER